MYELDTHCSCSIKRIIFICVGREWMHQMISKIHPHPQHCQGPWNPLLETLHSLIHLSILSPINSLHSFIHLNICSQVITHARHCVTRWEHRNYWQPHYTYRVKQACTHNHKMKISLPIICYKSNKKKVRLNSKIHLCLEVAMRIHRIKKPWHCLGILEKVCGGGVVVSEL